MKFAALMFKPVMSKKEKELDERDEAQRIIEDEVEGEETSLDEDMAIPEVEISVP